MKLSRIICALFDHKQVGPISIGRYLECRYFCLRCEQTVIVSKNSARITYNDPHAKLCRAIAEAMIRKQNLDN